MNPQQTQQTVAFDPNTGKPLAQGQTVTFQGKTYTGGSTDIGGTTPTGLNSLTPPPTPPTTLTQGQSYMGGTVNFDSNTGKPLAPGGTTTSSPTTANAATNTVPPQYVAMGITPDQWTQLNTPNGMAPDAFNLLLDNVKNKLTYNNGLMDQRALIMKDLFDSPLTPDEKAKLPPDVQNVLAQGKDAAELQLRVINDQLQGRSQSLSNSIQALTTGYQNALQAKKDAEGNILQYLQLYGSGAVPFLKAKYPEAADTIDQLAHLQTVAQQKITGSSSGSLGGVTTGTGKGILVAGIKVDSAIAGDVQDVLEGRNTLYNIRQTMGRTNAAAAYMQKMRDAIRSIDPSFDFVASDAGGKFVSSTFYQKAISAITSVEPNIDKAIDLSNQVDRIGVAAVDSLLQKANIQIGNTKVANFHEAQKLIADEIGLALGQGTVSDMKLQLGFDITDPSLSAEVFASNLGIVKEFIANRKKALTDQRYSSSVTGGTAGGTTSSLPPDIQTLVKNNLTFSADGKTAYLPRSIWSTLGANMDAVLAEAKADGVNLLIN
jgi:hypothetical protein